MKIAHIVCTYPPYYAGMGNTVFQTVSELIRRGHEVEVFTPSYYEEKEIKSSEEIPETEHAPALTEQIDHVRRIAPEFSYGNAARMGQIEVELDRFDIVHLHYPFFGTANIVRRWKQKHPDKKLVITYHMDPRAPDWRALFFKVYARFWMPKILHAADALIASSFDFVSQSDASSLFYSLKDTWFEIPFGVDQNRFQPGQKPKELCAQFGLNEHEPTVLFVGGLDKAHYFKGLPVLLDALITLKHSYQFEPQVIIAGEGGLRMEFERKAKYARLDRVRFVGFVPDELLPSVYKMADVFVLPSINRAEAFGLVLLEAMATGVPVIATDLPGVRSIADDGGIIVPPQNAQALAHAISEFFSMNSEDQIAWKTHAREIIEEKFSWEKVVDQLEEVYTKLAQQK